MLKVLKFGGTSVGGANAIKSVLEIIQDNLKQGHTPVIIASAVSGVTNKLQQAGDLATLQDLGYNALSKEIKQIHLDIVDQLIEITNQSEVILQIKLLLNQLYEVLQGIYLLGEMSPRAQDLLLSFGERMSCCLISVYISQNHVKTKYIDARDLIKTDKRHTNALVDFELTQNHLDQFMQNLDYVPIITGFIASTKDGHTTTLGRGGSDYTASIIGAGINADIIEIWTDVDGVMTADPRVVKDAITIPHMSYQEAMELSHFGAKIIYSPTLYPAFNKQIPLVIKNTFNPNHPGTMINPQPEANDVELKGITSIIQVAVLNIQGSNMVGVSGILSRVSTALAYSGINIVMVTQASSEHSISIVVTQADGIAAQEVLNKEFSQEIILGKIEPVVATFGFSIISIIGEGLHRYPGRAGEFFQALGRNGINITAIAQGSSELSISAVIPVSMLNKALNAVHQAFFVKGNNNINLFIIGVGLIGSTLIKQIYANSEYLHKHDQLKINLIGLANTKKMLFNTQGLDENNWYNDLVQGQPFDLNQFITTMKEMNLPHSIFVDCTGNAEIASAYPEILNSSIAISTPNKIANSSKYDYYEKLQRLAMCHNTKFGYETNVGAGLPIIGTLKNFLLSGDEIIKIEGVLSGTMSYIFNNFIGDKTFAQTVAEAKQLGYTEPDPRDDLNGKDVMRKILILARESGAKLELEDVAYTNILPEKCMKATSVEEFFKQLELHNDVFEKQKIDAQSQNKVLRFIASFANNQASVELKMVGADHPFYNLSGSDNMIVFTTKRYNQRPLVVQGPGAGAEVTASGVFAEIISIGSYLKV